MRAVGLHEGERVSPLSYLRLLLGGMVMLLAALGHAFATPPEYSTFGREQSLDHVPDPASLMRIWMVYVGQGDGILIQLPEKLDYDLDPTDDVDEPTERIDVLIDGGSHSSLDAGRMERFIQSLYGPGTITLEHAVITHHDSDHVEGLIRVLENPEIAVEAVYHNGLASYLPGKRGFPASGLPSAPAIYRAKNGNVARGMAFLDDDGETLGGDFFIADMDALRARHTELEGVYSRLGSAVVAKQEPEPVLAFQRAAAGRSFIEEREQDLGRPLPDELHFELLWPLDSPKRYGGWGETINGNSITFRLTYGEFEMLFTGDHNDKSEKALLAHLSSAGSLLDCDVLKVPHHGSAHAFEPFFRRERLPVLSVASMGRTGAVSKRIRSNAWQHPSTDVISWLGGAHRVYHTQLHERRFDWDDLDTEVAHEQLYEETHILIETDGQWFRLVEVGLEATDLNHPPSVEATRRGNGTRWIRAN